MNLIEIRKQVCSLAQKAGKFQVSELKAFDRNKIISKGYNDPVSYVDKESEKMLVEGLSQILPDAGFLTEEDTVDTNTDGVHWIIDPLDGTNNFVHQVPFFSISISLCNGHEMLIGVVHEPNRNECFSASLGEGAFINENKISVSKCNKLQDALVATGFPYSLLEQNDAYFNIMKEILHNSHGLRRFGSAALDLCYVACGRFDAYFEFNLNPWDVLGGSLIVREAGGTLTTFKGEADIYDGKEILATSGFERDMKTVISKHWTH
jgi:myo-inositol-1(or 4)-monophosphatase